jgi:hypothetical protein
MKRAPGKEHFVWQYTVVLHQLPIKMRLIAPVDPVGGWVGKNKFGI